MDQVFFKINNKLCNPFFRVILDIKDVQKLPKENISAVFLERSFEIKFMNLNGNNYKFGVPILHYKINPGDCKYLLKTDKIIISLKKLKKDDRWISLFKTKTIGGEDD
jgi:hypothetical protein